MSATQLHAMWESHGSTGGHWTGGDSTASVVLPGAWLSETFLGTVTPDGTRPRDTPTCTPRSGQRLGRVAVAVPVAAGQPSPHP